MPPEDTREFRERLKADIELGTLAGQEALSAAVRAGSFQQLDELLEQRLTGEEARCGLAFVACLHRRQHPDVRLDPDLAWSRRTDALIGAALDGAGERPSFMGARDAIDELIAISEAGGERCKLALAALALAYVGQRHQVIATAINANNN